MLSKLEIKELKILISLIEIEECFGSKDLCRESQLRQKATNEQLDKIFKELGIEKSEE